MTMNIGIQLAGDSDPSPKELAAIVRAALNAAGPRHRQILARAGYGS